MPAPPVSQSSVGRLFESRGEMGPPASARETQRVSPIPKVVFIRPIVGRLEDLITACLTTFHPSADTFELNNEDGSLRAVPQLDPPPLLAIDSQVGNQGEAPLPPMGLVPGNSGTLLGEDPGPPLLLQWSEGTNTEPHGAQNSAENPDSLGWKRSYAPFVSADGT